MSKVVEYHNGRMYVIAGWNWKQINLGFGISRWSIHIDLIWFWISFEY
jgi:hypothetical protein